MNSGDVASKNRSIASSGWILSLCVMPLLAGACATTQVDERPADIQDALTKQMARFMANPYDAAAARDLGVLYFQDKQFVKAEETLQRATQLNKGDAKAQFYLGMSQEYLEKKKEAVQVYARYKDASSPPQFASLMEGRYLALTRELIKAELEGLLAAEEKLVNKKLPENTVAVFPLDFHAGDEKYAPLGIGLSEMMMIDLAKVKKIRVVERIRSEELMKELEFGASSAVDPTTAPRLGRILAASRVIGGSYNVSEDNSLRIDASSLEVSKQEAPKTVTESDNLDKMFSVEKDVVFNLIKDMGLSITKEEREDIQRVPTRNLQSFMAYCVGLEKERSGDYQSASQMFRQAVTLDPGFGGAAEKVRASDAQSVASGKEKALSVASKLGVPATKVAAEKKNALVRNRASKLQEKIRAGFVPGGRRPAEDAFRNGATIGGLPAPPPPPGQ